MNNNFIDLIAQFLFDNKWGILKKLFFLIAILFCLVFLDKTFLFSESFIVDNKITQITQIENIKKEWDSLYQISTWTLDKLNLLSEEVFIKQGLYEIVLNTLRKVYAISFDIYTPNWIWNFWIFLSAQFIWLGWMIALSVENLIKKDFKNLVFTFLAFILIMTIWWIFLQIFHWFSDSNMTRSIIIENIILNLILWVVLFFLWKKTS